MESESKTTSDLLKAAGAPRIRTIVSVWGRDLVMQEKLQREAAVQNAALEKRIEELQETEKTKGMTKQSLKKLQEEADMLQQEKVRMANEAEKLKGEVARLREAEATSSS